MSPLDEYNVKLLDNVHPVLWNDPPGAEMYNLVGISKLFRMCSLTNTTAGLAVCDLI